MQSSIVITSLENLLDNIHQQISHAACFLFNPTHHPLRPRAMRLSSELLTSKYKTESSQHPGSFVPGRIILICHMLANWDLFHQLFLSRLPSLPPSLKICADHFCSDSPVSTFLLKVRSLGLIFWRKGLPDFSPMLSSLITHIVLLTQLLASHCLLQLSLVKTEFLISFLLLPSLLLPASPCSPPQPDRQPHRDLHLSSPHIIQPIA